MDADHVIDNFEKMEIASHHKFVAPNRKPACTWTRDGGDKANEPHRHVPLPKKPLICDSVLDHIGQTPLIRLNKIPKKYGIKCELLVKCEFFNAGGSVKDRIALRMIEEAERDGVLKPGYTIIEPTSGNTGIGLALAAAVKGYKCIIVMPEKMSSEKADTLNALGARIVRTPTAAAYDAPDSHISVAYKLMTAIKDAVILNQYVHPGNPLAHYDGTAAEILEQCGGKLDMMVVSAGTGGTVAGIGRKLKEVAPNCVIVGVDPEGSILAHNNEDHPTGFYEVEGIGYDFLPTVFDWHVVDKWYKCNDPESFRLARELIRDEGLLCGGSSGAALSGALEYAKTLSEGQRCVVILPDGVRNYMTKFLDDKWMIQRDFVEPSAMLSNPSKKPWFWEASVDSIMSNAVNVVSVDSLTSVHEVIESMKSSGRQQIPVLDADDSLVGIVTIDAAMKKIVEGKVAISDPVSNVMIKDYPRIKRQDTLGKMVAILGRSAYVVVIENESTDKVVGLAGIFNQVDFVYYLNISDKFDQE